MTEKQMEQIVKCRIWYLYSCFDCPEGTWNDPDDGNYYCGFNRNTTDKLRRISPTKNGRIMIPKWCKLPRKY
jgi:hypothetical protein